MGMYVCLLSTQSRVEVLYRYRQREQKCWNRGGLETQRIGVRRCRTLRELTVRGLVFLFTVVADG